MPVRLADGIEGPDFEFSVFALVRPTGRRCNVATTDSQFNTHFDSLGGEGTEGHSLKLAALLMWGGLSYLLCCP